MSHKPFFEKDSNLPIDQRYKETVAYRFIHADYAEFVDDMVKHYLIGISAFADNNVKRSRYIELGQLLLLSAIATISILLSFVLVSAGLGALKL